MDVGRAEVGVISYVGHHIVDIDGIADIPVPAGPVARQVDAVEEAAVGDVGEAVGHGDADANAVGLVGVMVFAGPPEAGAGALADGLEPGMPVTILPPEEAAFQDI